MSIESSGNAREMEETTSYSWDADDSSGVVRALSDHIEKTRGNNSLDSINGSTPNGLHPKLLEDPDSEIYHVAVLGRD